jgi:hypothetical protein
LRQKDLLSINSSEIVSRSQVSLQQQLKQYSLDQKENQSYNQINSRGVGGTSKEDKQLRQILS